MNKRMLLLCAVFCSMADAQARVGAPVAAQNRAHVGAAWTPGSTHATVGFESRMTVSISMDVGGFLAPHDARSPLIDGGLFTTEDPWVLRHGLFVTPGVRIPHRNRAELKWDVIVKGGFGPVWVADAQTRYDLRINPALVSGADLMLRYHQWGIRLENRFWYMKPFSRYQQVEIATVRPQIGGAVQYEF